MIFAKKRAARLHSQGQEQWDRGNDAEALKLYEKSIALDPSVPNALYNAGLVYKYQGKWEESLRYNARAHELDPNEESIQWNLAIAATALRRWDLARKIWLEIGLELDDSEGPVSLSLGQTPVRLNPDSEAEVVWGERIDPVRLRIESIPFPDSGYRLNDIVLHDGAATGYRTFKGQDLPVFNVLELFEPSDLSTYVAVVRVADEPAVDALREAAFAADLAMEDWSGNVRILCKQCSEGVPSDEHDCTGPKAWNPERRIGLSCADSSQVDAFVAKCQENQSVEILEVSLGLDASAPEPN